MSSDSFCSLAYFAILDLKNDFERPQKTIQRTQKAIIINKKE